MGNYTVSFYDRDMNRKFLRHFQNVRIITENNCIVIEDEQGNVISVISLCANTVIIESDNAYLSE